MAVPGVLPRSPITDADYAQLVQIVANDPTYQDWLNRLEKSGTVSADQIKSLRDQHNETIRKAKALVAAFADLHRK